jgi:hypothetical protein
MLRVHFATVSNRRYAVDVDPTRSTVSDLHALAADGLALDPRSLKLSCGSLRLEPSPLPLVNDAAALAAIPREIVVSDTASSTAPAVAGLPSMVSVSVVGVPLRVARRVTDVKAHTNAAMALSPSTADQQQTTMPSPSRHATAAGVIALPPPEALRGVVERFAGVAAQAHHRRRLLFTDGVVEAMARQVRAAADPDAALRSLLERLNVTCPAFIDTIVRPHQRDFLDAINGVVAQISLLPASLLAGDDDFGDIDVPGGHVTSEALLHILSNAILAEIANSAQQGAAFDLMGAIDSSDDDVGDSTNSRRRR